MNAVIDVIVTLWNQIVYAVSNIRVFDVIDILVIAYLIYKAIQFLRETRAGQLAKGIGVLIAVYLIAQWFELAVLRWVLAVVFNSAIILSLLTKTAATGTSSFRYAFFAKLYNILKLSIFTLQS